MDFTTRELTKEEGEIVSKDLTEILNKHNCEIGVVSSIQILKRVPKDIVSPFMPNNNGESDNTKETPETN